MQLQKNILILVITCLPVIAFCQIKNPVKWVFSSKKISADSHEIHLTATIEKGWHLYSQTTPEGGPVPTKINFIKNQLVEINGQVKEIGKLEQKQEPLFNVVVKQYSNKVDFVQLVKIKGNLKTIIKGTIDFMVCNDKECLPPKTLEFSIPIK